MLAVALLASLGLAAPSSAQAPLLTLNLTAFCTPQADFPTFRRFRVTNPNPDPVLVVLRNVANGGVEVNGSAPPGASYWFVPANNTPGNANTTVLLVNGVQQSVKASGNQPCAPTPPLPSCAVHPADILGWWRGENDLTAEIGPDLTGTSTFAPGRVAQGVNLAGLDPVGVDAFPTALAEVTVEAWVKPANTGQTQAIFSKWTWVGGDSDDTFALLLGGNGELLWMTDETTTRSAVGVSGQANQLLDGQFHHVAATWSRTEAAVFVDGQLVTTQPSQGGVLNDDPATPFRIGSQGGPGSPLYFSGVIDEPTIYGRALTAAEIAGIHATGADAKCGAPNAFVVGPTAEVLADQGGVDPVVSADGRFLVFRTRSTNIFSITTDPLTQVRGQDYDMFSPNMDDLVLLDTRGTDDPTDDRRELITVSTDELGGGLGGQDAAITRSGSHVAFASSSNDLVVGDTLSSGTEIFVRNRLDGTTRLVSRTTTGTQPTYAPPGNNNQTSSPSIDDSGNVVAFTSTMRTLVPEASPVPGDTWQTADVYVRDESDPNPANHTTTRLTVGTGGEKANGSSTEPIVSPDGRYVWFASAASNLVSGDTNGRADLFVHDRQTATTTRLDLTGATGQPLDGDAWLADVSPDGRWVSFTSSATTIVPSDTNGQSDAFLLDSTTGQVVRVSPATGQPESNGFSAASTVSDDGRFVLFESRATQLVPGDTNAALKGGSDVFVTDVVTGTTTRLSRDAAENEKTGQSASAVGSADLRIVVYRYQDVNESFFGLWRARYERP